MNILVVEDDELLAVGLTRALSKNDYSVIHASTGSYAISSASTNEFDLVILDLGLPDMDGLDVLREIRKSLHSVPVLVLTARDGVEHQVKGLNAGADDYMEKPFDLRELEARIKALIRRSHTNRDHVCVIGQLKLDPFQRCVTLDGELMELPAREYDVLEILVLRSPGIVSKQRLAQRLTADGEAIGDNAVEVYIHRIRRRLFESNVTVRTARGIGYYIEVLE
jgi:two-component system OmpR family response regulator